MIRNLLSKYLQWRRKCLTWKKYGRHTKYHLLGHRFDIGDYTYGVPNIHSYDAVTKLRIGKYCSLADDVQIILGGNHHVKWVSTYAFYQEKSTFPKWTEFREESVHRGDVKIGNDVWIGRNALILSGAEIGDGAVIGAGAVVAGKIPPYTIAVGNPAKVIRQRFSSEAIDRLLNIRWWDWPIEKIDEYLPLICSENIEQFFTSIERDDTLKGLRIED